MIGTPTWPADMPDSIGLAHRPELDARSAWLSEGRWTRSVCREAVALAPRPRLISIQAGRQGQRSSTNPSAGNLVPAPTADCDGKWKYRPRPTRKAATDTGGKYGAVTKKLIETLKT